MLTLRSHVVHLSFTTDSPRNAATVARALRRSLVMASSQVTCAASAAPRLARSCAVPASRERALQSSPKGANSRHPLAAPRVQYCPRKPLAPDWRPASNTARANFWHPLAPGVHTTRANFWAPAGAASAPRPSPPAPPGDFRPSTLAFGLITSRSCKTVSGRYYREHSDGVDRRLRGLHGLVPGRLDCLIPRCPSPRGSPDRKELPLELLQAFTEQPSGHVRL